MFDYALLERGVVAGAVLMAIGLTGVLARRTLLPVILSLVVMFVGTLVTLSTASGFHAEASGDWFGLCVFFAMLAFTAAGVMFAEARRRGGIPQEVSLAELTPAEVGLVRNDRTESAMRDNNSGTGTETVPEVILESVAADGDTSNQREESPTASAEVTRQESE